MGIIDNYRYSSLILQQNSVSGSLLKISCNVESYQWTFYTVTALAFWIAVLFMHDLATWCIDHL